MVRIFYPLVLTVIAAIGWTVVAQTPPGRFAPSPATPPLSQRPAGESSRSVATPTGDKLPPLTTLTASRSLRIVTSPDAAPVLYTLEQVRVWAWHFSPEGDLLDSEARAATCSVDPKDEESVCSARLIRSVLSELALGRRTDDAASAAKTYHQLVAAIAAIQLAQKSLDLQQKLIDLSLEAERLELPDGDPLTLRQQRIVLRDRQMEQTFQSQKLRQELARLTGRPEAEVAVAIPVDALPTMAPKIDAPVAVADGIVQRHDLRAIGNLCRGMNQCSLPAARQLLGAVSPGAGLSLASLASAGGLFSCWKDDKSDDDLAARKRQCEELRASLAGTVRHQTLQAVIDVRMADARLPLIAERLAIAEQRLIEKTAAIQIDKATPGSDVLIDLELQSIRADQLAGQLKLAESIDELNRVTSEPVLKTATNQ